ncbi:acetyltransferase, GNAT family [Bacteriovorax sp. BAL6_X]|uniref:GNAT family N-acetyltransferase n=1 Tax=Bacteriovorax sp. BAL6_X TaxID=1201290 RepID=UPI000386BC1A|nr:GNAT family N-acetyltransferase [Bacteriovorax sp. BAL6_X]EPZ50822.1 acetyltransferase, GNAT family [Bacteriovorax sp. BAL6_X]
MSKVILRYLQSVDEAEFLMAFNEVWEENFDFVHYWESIANKDFQTYVEVAPSFAKGHHIPKEHVPAALLFAFNEEGKIVGRTSIRFELNDHLLKVGGHIGYGVCPNFRNQGYATQILAESLNFVRNNIKGLKKVLVTCDEGNIGSEKTIRKNGGELENIIEVDGVKKMRFWIDL